ncbi:MAG TPA: acyltransferase family protein [Allosphingosinicella sp.]|jgi:peptidoglycan/LPS O-acetylase OafA/YrhL
MGGGGYRGDIEGLRAVAVLAVVLFHAGIGSLGGGFLGVDIFFVISGFLITGLVTREMDAGGFSLATFYQRRIARILPALVLMALAVLVAALLLCLPGEMQGLRGSAVATALFLSNLYFWRRDPYFAPPSEVQPLLHTWSLGVEEQFYLVYPILLLAGGRGGARLRIALVAAATGLSLTAAAVLATTAPQAAFYLLPTRLWELGLGGLVAFRLVPIPSNQALRELLCAVAVTLLLRAFLLVSPATGAPFPAAVLPCAAAFTLLALGEASAVGRLLALPPLRALGRLSYAFYLWHWPVLAFWRLARGFDMPPTTKVGLVLTALALAIVSYVAVERPLRRRLRSGRPFRVLAGGAFAALALAALAWGATAGQWRLHSLPAPVLRTLAAEQERIRPPLLADCRPPVGARTVSCLRTTPGRRNILLVGDSHAAHLWTALTERFPETHFLVSLEMNCRPVGREPAKRGDCRNHALDAPPLALAPGIDGVILAARWDPSELPALAGEIRALRAAGREVTLVGPVVEYLPTAPGLLARAQLAGDRRLYDHGRSAPRERLDRDMEPVARAAGARYFSAYRAECPEARPCRLFTRTGRPFHFDYGHYTLDGAREVVAQMPEP